MLDYWYSRLVRTFTGLVELLFPSVCLSCGDELVPGEEMICLYCLMDLPPTGLVGKWNGNPLMDKFIGKVSLTGAGAIYWFDKHSPAQHLMHALKYRRQPELGVRLGRLMGGEWQNSSPDRKDFAIIPVPLHPARLRRRGYNQAEQLALGFSEKTGYPVLSDVLIRNVNNVTQTGKSKTDRWTNVKSIFECTQSLDQPVILVDDVMTTGSTLEACIAALNRKGNTRIIVLTFAAARIST